MKAQELLHEIAAETTRFHRNLSIGGEYFATSQWCDLAELWAADVGVRTPSYEFLREHAEENLEELVAQMPKRA
ncbi:hypothetical protein DB347_20850 [Opitutaceae bacterium EW11]|nr:hypothetical protein DB347_20850 [Opitutaceae bacterium EW11]